MQIIRPMLNGVLLVSDKLSSRRQLTDCLVQKAALALQEQERMANEEEEKRLKAALKAKREPSTATSRVSSPSIGATGSTKDISIEQKPSVPEGSLTEDMSMDTDSPAVSFYCVFRSFGQILKAYRAHGFRSCPRSLTTSKRSRLAMLTMSSGELSVILRALNTDTQQSGILRDVLATIYIRSCPARC